MNFNKDKKFKNKNVINQINQYYLKQEIILNNLKKLIYKYNKKKTQEKITKKTFQIIKLQVMLMKTCLLQRINLLKTQHFREIAYVVI